MEIGDLARALQDFGAGYLLSTSGDGRVKAVTVEPTVVDGLLHVTGPGRGTMTNVDGNPQVTLLFPPLQQRGFTLLVDASVSLDGDDVTVTPASAVLHRPASHSDGPPAPDGCGHDCIPVP